MRRSFIALLVAMALMAGCRGASGLGGHREDVRRPIAGNERDRWRARVLTPVLTPVGTDRQAVLALVAAMAERTDRPAHAA